MKTNYPRPYRPSEPLPVVGADDRDLDNAVGPCLMAEDACAAYLAQFDASSCVGTTLTAEVDTVWASKRTDPQAPVVDVWRVRESGPCRCGCDAEAE